MDAADDDVFVALDRALVVAGQEPLGDLLPGQRRIISWTDGRLVVTTVPVITDHQARKVDGPADQG